MSENAVANKFEIPDMGGIFSSPAVYKTGVTLAESLSKSTIIPKEFQGNTPNCVIAVDMAMRTKFSPMMVMQNLYIVNGKPSWSSQFITALINNSGRFKSKLKFYKEGIGNTLKCYAYAEDFDGEIVKGPTIDMTMAQAEGWLTKSGSKWKTMPEVMIQYRAASFFGRMYCSDLLMGIGSEDEMQDMEPVKVDPISVKDSKAVASSLDDESGDDNDDVSEQQQLL